MAISARYRYIIEVNSRRDGWVRWFGEFQSEAEADDFFQMFLPFAMRVAWFGEFPLGMRVRKIIVFLPRRRHEIWENSESESFSA